MEVSTQLIGMLLLLLLVHQIILKVDLLEVLLLLHIQLIGRLPIEQVILSCYLMVLSKQVQQPVYGLSLLDTLLNTVLDGSMPELLLIH